MLLMLQYQEAQALQRKILPEIGVPDSVLLILVYDLLPVVWLVVLRGFDNKLYLILHPDEQIIPVRLPFDELYRMAHQLHQIVVIRKLPLAVGDIPNKGSVLFYVPCDINAALHIPIVVPVSDVLLEEAFSHCRSQVVRKQEQQEIEQPVVLIGIGFQIHDIWKIQYSVKQILKEIVLIFATKTRLNNQALIPATEKTHYISSAVGVVNALKNHLILCDILRIDDKLRKNKYAFPLQLLQSFVSNPTSEIPDL